MTDVLDILGINAQEKKMVVLGALLQIVHAIGSPASFEELYKKVGEMEGGRPGAKPLIYRNLTALEEEEYIRVNRTGYRHEYWTDFQMIRQAVEKHRQVILEDATSQLLELQKQLIDLNQLRENRISSVAKELSQVLTGQSRVKKPMYALGVENTYWLIDREIYDKARRGDVIRFVMDWIDPSLEHEMNRRERGEELLKQGIEIRSMLQVESLSDKQVYDRRAIAYRDWMKRNWKLNVRIRLEESRSYQFVSLNREGIVLIVAENPLTATWISRDVNPLLVDDAIDRFDTDFKKAVDPREMFGKGRDE